MSRARRLHFHLALVSFLLNPLLVRPQSLETRWRKEFSSDIEWYVRTSPGILVVKSGQGLTALDPRDGRQLWALSEVKGSGPAHDAESLGYYRGRNLLEVPGTGVLILNRMKLPGDSDGQLTGINLETGARVWKQPQIDGLVMAVPLQSSPDVVLVSIHLDRKTMARNLLLTAGEAPLLYYPYRLQFRRLNPLTGETRWMIEYPRTFNTLATTVTVAGDQLFFNHSNILLASLDLATGKQLWEEDFKGVGGFQSPVPIAKAEHLLFYGRKTVRAVDPATSQLSWEIKNLGKVTGIALCDDLLVAIGEDNVAAVDAKGGRERWRIKTHGHTTNLLWDKASDTIIYVDGKGLHTAERTTGKLLVNMKLDSPGHDVFHPLQIRMASSEVAVLIARGQVFAYNFKTGKHLLTAGVLTGFYPSVVFSNRWPRPPVGDDLVQELRTASAKDDWECVRQGTLLSASAQKNLDRCRSGADSQMEAYETQSEDGARKIWWIDQKTGLQAGFGVTGTQHDVSRQLGMVLAVEKNAIFGDAIMPK